MQNPITKTSTTTTKSGLSSVTAKKLTPTRKPISSTLTKTTTNKSPKVPSATNGISGITKKLTASPTTKKTVTKPETITSNGAPNDIAEKLNGLHINNGDVTENVITTTTTTVTTISNDGEHIESLINGNSAVIDNNAIIDLSAD